MRRLSSFTRGLPLFVLGVGLGVGLVALIRRGDLSPARFTNFTTILLGIFIEAVPFLLLGTLASGVVEVFVNRDTLERRIPHSALGGALVGGLMGFLFPVCECGVVPLARRLFRKGLPLPVGVAFLLAAPVANPIVLVSTATAFGVGRMLAWRFGLTLLIAVLTALVFAVERQPRALLRPEAWPMIQGASVAQITPVERPGFREGIARALVIAGDEFFEMGRYLVVGSGLAALMQTFVPQSTLLRLGTGPVLSVLVLVALAVVLSICSTVDSFVALAFVGSFTPGAVLGFLVFGPMVDIKSTLMFLGVFRRKTVVYLILLPLAMTIVAAVFLNLFGPGIVLGG
jgi:uncharacterized membrane protein YraQ (UPF0718 family)